MANLKSIRAGLATRAKTIGGMRAYPEIPDSINPPVLIFGPAPGTFAQYHDTFEGKATWTLIGRLLLSRWDAVRAQDALDPYVSTSGALSVVAALEGDPTLGGVAEAVGVLQASGYGRYPFGGVDYLGCDFLVQVLSA